MDRKIDKRVFGIVLKAWTKLDLICKAYDVTDEAMGVTADLNAYMSTCPVPEKEKDETKTGK